jgi:hypothetical protein
MSAPDTSSPWRWVTRVLRVAVALAAAWLLILIARSVAGHDINRPRFESAGLIVGFLLVPLALIYARGWRVDGVESPPQPLRITPSLIAIPAAVAVASFAWALTLGPLSDDFVLSSWARTGTLVSQDWAYARPFPLLLWAILLKLAAGWPVLHALNVLCHAANAALLSVIVARVLQSRSAGLWCGLAFALFPANFETVAWTAGVFDAIATLSVVVAAAMLLTAQKFSWRTVSAIAVLGVIAVLSKETGVMLPFLLACLLPFVHRRNPSGSGARNAGSLQALALSAVVVGVYAVIRATTISHAMTSQMPDSPWQLKNTLVRPYGSLAMPFHRDAPALLAPIAAAIVILIFLLPVLSGASDRPRRGRGLTLMVAGLVWTLLATLPLLNQFFVASDLQGSRYLYLPLAGFAMALAGAVEAARFRALSLAALALLGAIWVTAWPWHVRPWNEAAALRDVVLREATRFVTTNRCSSLEARGEPDNVRGAYVFRTGLTDALQKLPYRVDGVPCVATWASGHWVSAK